ncbi:MAG TPA: glycosyltransferase family 1 protein [Candidatus Krumholzibacteriaceae bacterium]|nr:glycosyltransferase family 1 protein [Candidatus Krumholzibacteriaceae bacterium]
MKIGLEVTSVITDEPTGIARYINGLISAFSDEIEDHRKLILYYKLSRLHKRSSWSRPENLKVREYYKSYWPVSKNVDIIHGLDVWVPFWSNVKKVVTIHDLLILKQIGNEIASEKFHHRKERLYKKISKQADCFITVSESTKRDLVNLLNVSPDKVNVVYHGVDESFFPQENAVVSRVRNKYGLKRDYLLFVGTISERKNTERLVEAFSRSKASSYLDLVLAGTVSYKGDKTLRAVKKYHLDSKVKILGFVEEDDLPALYSGAIGFVFPTLYEGFGLPVLEAMACATPVLAGNKGAVPEISGNLAIYVNPLDTCEITEAIDRLPETPQSQIARCVDHANSFTWKRCVGQTLNIYRKLLQ